MADTTNYIGLETAILEDGIRSKNFFNGRLLSAEDLRQEQEENRKAYWRLGEATGDGVAYGFEVSPNRNSSKESPIVDVNAGLAVSRSGKVLKATKSQSIALTAQGAANVDGFASFTPCQPLLGGTYKAGPGLYVLTVTSAFANAGRAQVSGLGNSSVSCNTDNVIEGLQFRLLEVSSEISAPPGDANFRNRVAYEFFYKIDSTQASLTNPFRLPSSGYGVLDALRDKGLTDCDVPLAFIFWSAGKGIEFVDMWPVRRRLVGKLTYGNWELSVGDRRRSEAEAAFLQFQTHLDSIRQETGVDLPTFKADSRFRFLPPAGYLTSDFPWQVFLGPMAPLKAKPIDGGLLTSILQQSLLMEPIRVVSFTDGLEAKKDPPVPLDVFKVPSESFVLFARSAKSRMRAFFKPPSSLQSAIVEAKNSSNSLTFNGELPVNGNHLVIQDAPPGDHSIQVTANGFVKPGPLPVEAISGRTIDLLFELTPLPRGSVAVSVFNKKDKDKNLSGAVQAVSATNSQNISFPGKQREADWFIPDLPVDSYAVKVIAPNFKAGIEPTVAVTAGTETTIKIELVPAEKEVGELPPLQVDTAIQFTARKPLGVNLAMQFKDPSDGVLNPSEQPGAVQAKLDSDGFKWLLLWQDYLEELYPGNDIGRFDPQVFLSKELVAALLGKEGRSQFLDEFVEGRSGQARGKIQFLNAFVLFGNGSLGVNVRLIRLPEK